jgi:hypothetical protein
MIEINDITLQLCTIFNQIRRKLPTFYLKQMMIEEEFEDTNGIIRIRKSQWSKEKVQKDKQRSTKHTQKTEDRIIVASC